ncbi:hypothetical protein DIPPA_21055 [Diplonema papillatum]|nr:hypothetical protein DIPPA_21055 [Diplonema papillatum]
MLRDKAPAAAPWRQLLALACFASLGAGDLVSYLKYDNDYADAVTSAAPTLVTPSVSFSTAGVCSAAVSLPSNESYVTYSSKDFPPLNGPFTFSTWLKVITEGTREVVSLGDPDSEFVVQVNANRTVTVKVHPSPPVTSSVKVPLDSWGQLVVACNGQSVVATYNFASFATFAVSPQVSLGSDMTVGRVDSDEPAAAVMLDEVKFHDRFMAPSEILSCAMVAPDTDAPETEAPATVAPTLTLVMRTCHGGNAATVLNGDNYPIAMHPTQLRIAGSLDLGVVVINCLIVALLYMVSAIAVLCLKSTKYAKEHLADPEGFLYFPSVPLFTAQVLHLGTTFGAARLAFYPPFPGATVLGCAVAILCLALPVAVARKVQADIPRRAAYMLDAPAAAPAARLFAFFAGPGEWVSARASNDWVRRFGAATRSFKTEFAWHSFMESTASAALSFAMCLEPESLVGCGHVRIACGCVFLTVFFVELWNRPRCKPANQICILFVLFVQALGMFCLAVSFYLHHDGWFTFAEICVSAAVYVLLAQAILDLVGECCVMLTGRRARLQAAAFCSNNTKPLADLQTEGESEAKKQGKWALKVDVTSSTSSWFDAEELTETSVLPYVFVDDPFGMVSLPADEASSNTTGRTVSQRLDLTVNSSSSSRLFLAKPPFSPPSQTGARPGSILDPFLDQPSSPFRSARRNTLLINDATYVQQSLGGDWRRAYSSSVQPLSEGFERDSDASPRSEPSRRRSLAVTRLREETATRCDSSVDDSPLHPPAMALSGSFNNSRMMRRRSSVLSSANAAASSPRNLVPLSANPRADRKRPSSLATDMTPKSLVLMVSGGLESTLPQEQCGRRGSFSQQDSDLTGATDEDAKDMSSIQSPMQRNASSALSVSMRRRLDTAPDDDANGRDSVLSPLLRNSSFALSPSRGSMRRQSDVGPDGDDSVLSPLLRNASFAYSPSRGSVRSVSDAVHTAASPVLRICSSPLSPKRRRHLQLGLASAPDDDDLAFAATTSWPTGSPSDPTTSPDTLSIQRGHTAGVHPSSPKARNAHRMAGSPPKRLAGSRLPLPAQQPES